jgi:CheY-like chemotaxis protein
MSARPAQKRLPRREVRLGCWVELDRRRLLAFTNDVSEGGLSLQLSPGHTFSGLEVGAALVIRLLLEPDQPLEGVARVVWVDPNDRDVRDRPVVGFGVQFLELSPAAQERIREFLCNFRHALLLLEDDPEYEPLYQALAEHYRVLRCAGSVEALKLLESTEVSALLLGEQLPEGHCLAFLQTLSERLPNVRASRVLLSEYTIAGQLQVFANQGRLFSFLRKPFGARELQQAVQRAVDAYVLETENSVLLTALGRANERLQKENAYLRQRVVGHAGFEQVIGCRARTPRCTCWGRRAPARRCWRAHCTRAAAGPAGRWWCRAAPG